MGKKFIDALRSVFEHSRWGYPLLLLLVGLVAYGYSITQLGFYWDDWEVVYLTQLASWEELFEYFMFERPFAWPYPLYASVVGASPLGWHLVTFLLRYAGVLLLYLTLVNLWPSRKFELGWAGLLLLVFPGFLQQSTSTAYSRHFTSFFLFSLSLYWTVLAVRARSFGWLYWIGSLVTGILQIFTIEYYVGLELIRPIVLWILFEGDGFAKRLRRIFISWAPFFLAFVCFLWWKMVYMPSLRPSHVIATKERLFNSLVDSPLQGFLSLIQNMFFDTLHLLFQVWFVNTYNPNILNFTAKITVFALVAALLLAALAFITIRHERIAKDKFFIQAFVLGSAALLFGGLPVWAFGKTLLGEGIWGDRFSQGPMLGAVLLSVLLISLLVKLRWKAVVLAVMLVSALVTQIVTVNKYRLDWEYQRQLYWQMVWRAPALSPHTAIYSRFIPSIYLPEYDASFAFALLYADEKTGTNIPYWYFTLEKIAEFKIRPDKPTTASVRNINFEANSSDGISVFYHPSRGCLRVLDPIYQSDPIYFEDQSIFFPLSNPQRIQAVSSRTPNAAIFGQEPPQDWCYFFEKGDLARQFHRWQDAIHLYEQAVSSGFSPHTAGEYLPFIDSYVWDGDFEKALKLTTQAIEMTADIKPAMCASWQRLGQEVSIPASVLAQVETAASCAW